jgi:hypothetical protein
VTGPAGAFRQPTQVAITAPPLSQLNSLAWGLHGDARYAAATGFGLIVSSANGRLVKGLFARSLSAVLTGPTIAAPDEKALDFITATSAARYRLSFGHRAVSFAIDDAIFVVILNPALPAPRDSPAPTRSIPLHAPVGSGDNGAIVGGIAGGGALLALAVLLLFARSRSRRERAAEEPVS